MSGARARGLGPVLATVLVAGNMIGSGVYMLPATLAAIGSSSLLGWVIATLGALVLALVFVGLSRVRPGFSGVVDYVSEGLGRFFGFQAGTLYLASNWIGNVGIAVAVTGYAAYFYPVLHAPLPAMLATLAVIWFLAGVNIVGPRLVTGLGGLTLLIGLAPILAAIGLGVMAFDPHLFAASWNVTGGPLTRTVPASLVSVFWAFLGLESASVAASVVKNPERNVPIATLAGVVLAAVVYIAATTALMGVMPASELARSTAPFADAVRRLAGDQAGLVVAACALLKTVGTLAGWMLVTAETSRASAARGQLPRWMSHGRPEGVPVRDVIATAVLMSVVTLATVSPTLNQQFNVLINVSVVLYMAIYAYCCVALVRLSGALPRTARLAAIAWALIAFAFCVWVVSASDLALVIPAAVILALTVLVWPVVRLRGRPTTEPPVAA